MYWCEWDSGAFKYVASAQATKKFAYKVVAFLEERLAWE